jgi:Domain of unknown function (DUF5122) beta-propeller
MAVVFGAWGLVMGTPAFALVAATPTPTWQTNGRVNVIVVHKNRVYIGGQFTAVRPPGAAAGSQEVTRNHVAAFNLAKGTLVAWNPNANGTVRAIQVIGKTVYLGGSFTRVGNSGRQRLAQVNNTSGAPTAWHPGASSEVLAMGHAKGYLYVGGGFTTAGGASRAHLAAFSTKTGNLTNWSPSTDDQVKALVITPGGARVVVGGLFTQVNGSSANHIAAINPGGSGTLASWGTHLSYPVIDLAADSKGVYVAGAGGGGNFAGLSLTGQQKWLGGTNGNVQAISVVGGVVYVGGHMQTYCGPQHGQHTCTNPIPRDKLLAVDEDNGNLLPWAPGADSALGVFALRGIKSTGNLLAGGDFRHTGNRAQQGFALFSN